MSRTVADNHHHHYHHHRRRRWQAGKWVIGGENTWGYHLVGIKTRLAGASHKPCRLRCALPV